MERNKLQRPPHPNKFNFKGPNKKKIKEPRNRSAVPVLREYAHMHD